MSKVGAGLRNWSRLIIAYLVENISREKAVRAMQTVIATHNETDKQVQASRAALELMGEQHD